ncbi:MAG: hypothetical protein AAFV49_21515, partial [Pseudomonadota bacterium]
SAAFAAPFANAPAPMPMRSGIRLLGSMAGILAISLLGAAILVPYPAVLLGAIIIALALSFRHAVMGGHMLVTVAALLGALLVPYLMLKSPALAGSTTFWLMVNFALGLVASWAAFALFPAASDSKPMQTTTPEEVPDLDRRLLRMCLVSTPFVVVYFVTGSGAFYTLIFVALLAAELAACTGSGAAVARGMLRANLMGGGVAFLTYEAIVIAPLPVMAVLVTLTMSLFFSSRIAKGDALAASALTVALLLLGGALVFSNDADARLIDRIGQIALALGYILFAFVVIDRWLPERTMPKSDPISPRASG